MENHLKLENQTCFPLYVLSREIIRVYRPLLEEIDLTYPQYLVLMVLWEQGKQTVNQIGDKLYLDSGTLTPLLKRLESKGLIQRTRSAKDERVVSISLTSEGEALQLAANGIPAKLVEKLDLSIEELRSLKELTCKILSQIQV
ncbi:MarR family winged helix-turn-helix transcriptional regulator [Sphingobacterium sp. LRF_L2]|uniref:MarR family winged helix-turn-helix transcriptional regulator n=1 Tax=Sphingobacterium sp. LRF_L2 TaxID=3369421 RepID=UPI003F5FC291